jgi:hypothetical protein
MKPLRLFLKDIRVHDRRRSNSTSGLTRSTKRPDPRPSAVAEDERYTLRALVGVVDEPGVRAAPRQRPLARVDDRPDFMSARIDQPTTRREKQASTDPRQRTPSQVGICLRWAHQLDADRRPAPPSLDDGSEARSAHQPVRLPCGRRGRPAGAARRGRAAGQLADLSRDVEELANQLKTVREATSSKRADTPRSFPSDEGSSSLA